MILSKNCSYHSLNVVQAHFPMLLSDHNENLVCQTLRGVKERRLDNNLVTRWGFAFCFKQTSNTILPFFVSELHNMVQFLLSHNVHKVNCSVPSFFKLIIHVHVVFSSQAFKCFPFNLK